MALKAVRPESIRSKRPCSTLRTMWSMRCSARPGRTRSNLFSTRYGNNFARVFTGSSFSLDGVAFGVRSLELKSQTRPRSIRGEYAALWVEHPVEEHVLDPGVVVEVLQVPQGDDGAASVGVQRGRRVRRELHTPRLAEGTCAQKAGYPRAPSRVGLQHVHRLGLEHPAEVVEIVYIFAGGDLH